jgi:hypothetical protein
MSNDQAQAIAPACHKQSNQQALQDGTGKIASASQIRDEVDGAPACHL